MEEKTPSPPTHRKPMYSRKRLRSGEKREYFRHAIVITYKVKREREKEKEKYFEK